MRISNLPRRARVALGIAAVLAPVLASPAAAQSLAARAARVQNGVVRLSYATRPGVCGNGSNMVNFGGDRRTHFGDWNGNREWEQDDCEPGPARVSVTVEDGRPLSLRVYVGGQWRPGGEAVTDLGAVSPREAADWLMSLAEASGSTKVAGRVASHAILAATLADSVVVWPRLMRLARDESRARETRKQAVFWLSQAAGDAATAGLDTLVGEAALDRGVREQAVFALSQRPHDEGVPVLLRIARTNRDPEIRRKAIFWLGQSEDPRALALFEELLGKP